jgi:cation diffusion facilitator CzcD-associated flavoprotein CzcO
VMDMPKEDRQTAFEELWSTGGLHFWLGTYFDVLTNEEANEEAYQFWRQQVITRIKDPEKARVLAPEKKLDPFGAKRASLEQNYYDVLNKDNVAIVYLRENPIEEFVSLGAKTQDGQIHEIDVLVMATGFDFVTGGLTQIDIRGINGESVKDKFAQGVRTNLGMTIHGFPNMFFMYGPQAPTAFATGPICAETQGQWIVKCINYLTKYGFKSINATEEAERDWADHVNEVGNIGLFKNASSWYFGDNIPGKPRQALNYMAGLPAYKERCQDSASMGYRGFQIK